VLAQDPATLDAAGLINFKNVSLLHDARLQMSAPQLVNLWTRYDVVSGSAAGVYLAGGINRVHDQTLLPDGPASSRQSYTLVQALAGYSWLAGGRRISLELAGKNLGGATYRPSQSTRARPREVLLTLRAAL
jgi:iron complex outermembrane receptor protein